jgi:UDP-N-acetylglucosamine:LPS N-acetylglucosamine transferase
MNPEPPVTSTSEVMSGNVEQRCDGGRVGRVHSPDVRVLILSADIGEGHDLPARAVRDGVLALRPDAEVAIVDTIAVSGRFVRATVRSGSEVVLRRMPRLFDAQYWVIGRFPPTRAFAGWLAERLSGRRVARLIAQGRWDVAVCTYPVANEALSRLRARGRLDVPVISAITDLAALRYWSHAGCDLHLVIHPESAEEIRGIAGPDADVVAVRGLTGAAFDTPVDRAAARQALDVGPHAPLVVVSGGGWGVGDVRGAVTAALAAGPDVHVIALCGRNDAARATVTHAFAGDPRVQVWGFTDRMSELFGAADVLVHSTAGLTVLEALVRGMRVVSYGWGVAHIRVNNQAYRRFGLAEVAGSPRELTPAVRRALASPRRPDLAYGRRPMAAALVVALAEARPGALEAGDGAGGAEQAAAEQDQREAGGDGQVGGDRPAPGLAEQPRGQRDGDRRLEDEHGRRDAGGLVALQGGHVDQQAEAGGGARDDERGEREARPVGGQLGDEQLAGDRGEREGAAGADDERPGAGAAGADDERRGDARGQDGAGDGGA